MIDDLIDRNREVIRQSLKKVAASKVETTNALVNDALDYFERDGDHEKVRSKYKERGGTGIRKIEGEAGYETYDKQRVHEQIDTGEIEVITSGVGTSIVNKLSGMFTNPTQSWTYVDTDDEPIEEGELAELFLHRQLGGFGTALPQADWISNAIGSGPLLVSWSSEHLVYAPFSPSCLYAKYHDMIMDNGEMRGVSYKDLEDASVVVIETSTIRGDGQDHPDKNQYLAIFGRSDEYPLGRHVQYAASTWDAWPAVGSPDALDWTTDSDEIANPLSWLAAKGEGYGVEYPIAIIDGGIQITSEKVAPVTTSLYESCLEIDVAFSRVLKDSLSNAMGLKIFNSANNTHVPRCLEKIVHLMDGQTLEIETIPNENARIAFEIAKGEARSIAEGFGVPGYTIIAEGTTVPESGVALAIRTKPLIDNRQRRVQLNQKPVAKIYDIERGLHEVHTGKPLLPGTRQVWNAGRFHVPESELDKLTRLSTALKEKAITYVQFIRDLHNLPTDDDAKQFIEQMNETNAEFPPPAAPTAPRPGLPPGITPRGPRVV